MYLSAKQKAAELYKTFLAFSNPVQLKECGDTLVYDPMAEVKNTKRICLRVVGEILKYNSQGTMTNSYWHSVMNEIEKL